MVQDTDYWMTVCLLMLKDVKENWGYAIFEEAYRANIERDGCSSKGISNI